MGDLCIHIGEILARNARMYPHKIALVERTPAEKKRFTITWREFDVRVHAWSHFIFVSPLMTSNIALRLRNRTSFYSVKNLEDKYSKFNKIFLES